MTTSASFSEVETVPFAKIISRSSDSFASLVLLDTHIRVVDGKILTVLLDAFDKLYKSFASYMLSS